MKAKNKHLNALSTLSAQHHPKTLDAQKSYALCMLAADVKKHATVLDATKMEVAKKFQSKDPKAQPGQIDNADVPAYLDELKPIIESEIEITDVKLTFDEARGFELSSFEFADLFEIGIITK